MTAVSGGGWSVDPVLRRRAAVIGAVSLAIACLFVAVLGAESAQAFIYKPYERFPLSASPSATQAGGHPDLHVEFSLTNHNQEEAEGVPPSACRCEDARDATTRFPAGIIGNPNNVPRCTQVDFNRNEDCSPDTQVGVAHPGIFGNPGQYFESSTPLYNLETHPGQAGLLGFFLPLSSTPAYIVLSARTGGDFGLTATVKGIEHLIPADGFVLDLWGVPAESSHDSERCTEINIFFGECTATGPSNAELKPFVSNPTTCDGVLSSSLEVLYYSGRVTFQEASWPASTGCDQLTYNPSLFAQPTTRETDSPSGLDVDLRVPQLQSPRAPSPSETRATTVTLPEGMAINPNAADGKTSCSDNQARFGTEEEADCPELAKVGTLSLTSTALPGPLPGAIYLGEPKPGNRYRLFLTANGFATHVKLAGSVETNPQTGQLVVSFQDLPQSPFSDFNLHFFGSERGLLTTPPKCGTYPVTSEFTPWDAALSTQTSTQFFTLDSGPNGTRCPASNRPFNPGFEAGVTDATSGAHSPFLVHLTRPDGDQTLAALSVSTPPGFSATLSGVPYCPNSALAAAAQLSYSGLSEIANPSCPAASQIGTAMAGAGAGNHPLYLPGRVYLAGPYKGAPISLAVITPAVSGPYDLGDVVVRAAIHVDPTTAQITADSDPLPQILQGIPLQLRSILINLDRKNFTLNPTNCDPFSVKSEVFGDQGAVATPGANFQVASCRRLPFGPKLDLKLSGATRRAGSPSLRASLSAKPGEANISSTVVTLPPSEQIANAHIKDPCTRVQFAADACPPGSVIGFARAETPLLEKPLEGPVYLRSAPENKSGLPDVVAALNGQIDIVLDGKIKTVKKRLRTTFPVPDAPVSKFTLTLDGGSRGLLENNENLCASPRVVTVTMAGQNGKSEHHNQTLAIPCGKSSKRKSHPRRTKVVG